MTPEEKYELYERKISGELSTAEEETLSLLLKEDTSIAEEFELYKEWSSYLDANLNIDKDETDLTHNLKEIGDSFFDKEVNKKTSKVIQIPFWVYTAAASVAIIFGVYVFTNGEQPTYADFAVIPELSIAERGGVNTAINDLEVAFNSGNYKEAEAYLLALLTSDGSNSEYNFYYGITLLEQDKHAEATAVFEKLIHGNSGYKNRAIWFEALNQLKQKNIEQCTSLLKKIPKDAEDYKQAQRLIKNL